MIDYHNFLDRIGDLDRRMATIICVGYDDCSGLEAVYKVQSTDHFSEFNILKNI